MRRGENRSTRRKTSRSKNENQQQTQPMYIWRRVLESNPGHIGGRRVLSPLRHPCSPFKANNPQHIWSHFSGISAFSKDTCYSPGCTDVTRASEKSFENRTFDFVRLYNFFCVRSISFDCRTKSNSIHGLSSIGFDLLCREHIFNDTTYIIFEHFCHAWCSMHANEPCCLKQRSLYLGWHSFILRLTSSVDRELSSYLYHRQ